MATSSGEARKQQVLQKLDEAMNYCNSHHDPAQERFEHVVDAVLSDDCGIAAPEQRRREMKALFPVLLNSELRGFIPSLKLNDSELALNHVDYLDCWLSRWTKKYLAAWKMLPSQRTAKPKGAATDEALIQLLIPHAGSEAEARAWARHHNYFMSAENTGGSLLEEYVASKVTSKGWVWCRGEILTAVDFCRDDCSAFIQVKNKSNTENSSSKGFRDSHNAPMWYRMEAERKAGKIVTRWPELMSFIKEHSGADAEIPGDLMSESDYLSFVRKASEDNAKLINGEEKGFNFDEVAY